MPLGWIDFSKSERNKVLSVLDMLSESATLDELGIAPIRDGFANLFFPGTSTIQTRAKYFFLVPYALKDMELGSESNPNRIQIAMNQLERDCGKALLELNPNENGIIGKRSLNAGNWVKRTPADIYWAGLRTYGIFVGGNMSMGEYIRAMCVLKNQKGTLKKLGNRNDNADEADRDDERAGDVSAYQFWRMPLYQKGWFDSISMDLTQAEGEYLKEQIILSCPNSMLAYILKNDMKEILEIGSFQALGDLIHLFPENMQADYELAVHFSDFIYAIRTIYNVIVSEGQLEAANEELERLRPLFSQLADIDVDFILNRLNIFYNPGLRSFLKQSQDLMKTDDIEGLTKCIKNREISLKGQSRAKTCHPDQFQLEWIGGGDLAYRFGNARIIIRDIFESEVTDHA